MVMVRGRKSRYGIWPSSLEAVLSSNERGEVLEFSKSLFTPSLAFSRSTSEGMAVFSQFH
jgi:hypothetical protein